MLEEKQLRQLVDFPHEDLNVEVKGWLDLDREEDRANLAKAIIAIANSGGGYVLCGFRDDNGRWVPASPRPDSLDAYSQDRINGIVQRYAEPAFHCSVHHVLRSDTEESFPVIVVPGNHTVPIRTKRDGLPHVRKDSYYIRRPGPSSGPPQTGQEWEALIGRCIRAAKEELLKDIRQIIHGPTEVATHSPGAFEQLRDWEKICLERWRKLVEESFTRQELSPYRYGVWTASYRVEGEFQPPSLSEFKAILERTKGHETGWPPWRLPARKEISPYIYDGAIECWMAEPGKDDGAHSDFWRASPYGLLFLLRGYQEDSEDVKLPAGKVFDLTLPIWRVGEVLLHAQRLSNELVGGPATIYVRFCWGGLSGRELVAWASRRYVRPGRVARQPTVVSELSVEAESISKALPELVNTITRPLYEVFDFMSLPLSVIQEELSEMLGKRGR